MLSIHKTHTLCFALLMVTGPLLFPAQAAEGPNTNIGESNQPIELEQVEQQFKYQLDDRPDPFVPFISQKVATQKLEDEIVDVEVELTGMQKFEPGQLKLVAVMYSGRKRIAMVEDVTGKGYILKEDMPIGRRGVVDHISGEEVTIIETAHTRAGRTIKNQVVMRLQKEGDK